MANRLTVYEGHNETVRVTSDGSDIVFTWQSGRESKGEEMARFATDTRLLRMFPKKRTLKSLDPQFGQIAEVQIDTALLPSWNPSDAVVENDYRGTLELSGLPDGFGKIFLYGLGMRRAYRGLVHFVEETTPCTIVRFGARSDEGVESSVICVALERFTRYKAAVDLNKSRGSAVVNRVNSSEAHNALADLVGLPIKKPTLGRHPIIRAITLEVTGQSEMDPGERRMLVEEMSAQSEAVAVEAPGAFGKLRRDIELVSLEVLIQQFNAALTGDRTKDESHWQRFFETNPFALQQLFAAPIALYKAQLTVKGVGAFGAGSRIADFMLVNTVTRTAVVVEIKTPAARLTGQKYRGSGGAEVFLPHGDLLGAVSQLQAQLESARVHLPQLLAQTPGADALDTCVVRGAVIAGRASSLGQEEKASFLRYRDGLGDVEVLAFDEVRDRLIGLHRMLSSEAEHQ